MKKFVLFVSVFLFGCGSSPNTGSVRQLDLTDDPYNCGATGYVCLGGRDCEDSRCTPVWESISDDGAPDSRGFAAAAQIDNKYAVFGGCVSGSVTDTGGLYDPSNDTWSSFPNLDSPRAQLSAVSTDSGIFVTGGISICFDGTAIVNSTSVLYSTSDSWEPMDVTGFSGAYNVGFVWTKDRLFRFGGSDNVTPALSSVGILSLVTEWVNNTCPLSGCERAQSFSMFVDGPFIRVWGGDSTYGTAPDGLLYSIAGKTWSSWTVPNGTPDFQTLSPSTSSPRFGDDGRRLFYLTPGGTIDIYDRQTLSWVNDTEEAPMGFCNEGATAWVNGVLVVWSGYCDSSYSSSGFTYQPPSP